MMLKEKRGPSGLREKIDKRELASMEKKVEASYTPPKGEFGLKGLDIGHNPQYNLIRSREWSHVVKVMTEAVQPGYETDRVGHTWDTLGAELLERLKRVQRFEPKAVPDFAVENCQSACYFALAIAQYRKKHATEVVRHHSR